MTSFVVHWYSNQNDVFNAQMLNDNIWARCEKMKRLLSAQWTNGVDQTQNWKHMWQPSTNLWIYAFSSFKVLKMFWQKVVVIYSSSIPWLYQWGLPKVIHFIWIVNIKQSIFWKVIYWLINWFITLPEGEGMAFGSICYLAKIFICQVCLSVSFVCLCLCVCSICLSLSVCLFVCQTIFGHSFQAIVLNF